MSYIAHNHVGFRRVVMEETWKQGETPSVKVDKHDIKGICLFLSTDAFVEWENIVSPTKAPPWQGTGADCFPVALERRWNRQHAWDRRLAVYPPPFPDSSHRPVQRRPTPTQDKFMLDHVS